ncbi:MAG TPA: biotin/lipoyl-containing protein, partial [Candidatus Limnocylindrales bacterium]|nr:biotin/lipoyl-containing protein [Candidatus Limnocylindrales bacterium]
MAKVTMPQLGESVAEGTIGKWLKKPGDSVAKYEPLLEVITDKVNAEVPSPFEGILREILVEEGATVPNNAEIAVIETADEAGGTSAAAPAPQAASAATEKEAAESEPDTGVEVEVRQPEAAAGGHGPAGSDERRADDKPDRAAAAAGAGAPSATAPTAGTAAGGAPVMAAATSAPAGGVTRNGEDGASGNADARMTPAVRRLLREHGLSPAQIVGTGGGGRITRDDVTNFVESQRTGQPVNGQSAAKAAAPAPAAAPATPAPASGGVPAPAPASPGPAASRAAGAGTSIEFPAGADEVLVPMTQ